MPFHFFMDRYTDSFTNELCAFIQAVREDLPTPVNDQRVEILGSAVATGNRYPNETVLFNGRWRPLLDRSTELLGLQYSRCQLYFSRPPMIH